MNQGRRWTPREGRLLIGPLCLIVSKDTRKSINKKLKFTGLGIKRQLWCD